MSLGVEFDEDRFGAPPKPQMGGGGMAGGYGGQAPYSPLYAQQQNAAGGGIAGWLQRHGIAKSDKSAQTVMVAIIVANIVITIVVIYFFL